MSGKFSPSDYGIRLKKAMQLAGMLNADGTPKTGVLTRIAQNVGISSAAVGMVLTGQSKRLAPDNSARVARFLKVDHFWLATGEGEPQPPGLSEEALAWARRYDRLDEQGRAKFSAAIIIAQNGVPDATVEKQMPITAKRRHTVHEKG